MVSAMGISSTLTVSGSSCTVSTTYNGTTTTGMDSVVSACH
jgi:hypothetical protein